MLFYLKKNSHKIFLEANDLPVKILVHNKKKKYIVFPVWLITLFESRNFILKIYKFFNSTKLTDPNDPDNSLIESILENLALLNKGKNE